jgi:Holliday junction DNA helicase RuvA
MISYLKGKVVVSRTGFIILETGGVGYGVNVDSATVLANGESTELFIHQHIREDLDDLYGFQSFDELNMFEKLITVSGVGPKAGLNIMSSGKSDKIIRAIISDDLNFFTAVPGIGKKVAAKIILELKSKLSGDQNINVLAGGENNDLFDALESLGYKKNEIASFINKIPAEIITTEEKIRWCLKKLAKS